MHVVVSTSLQTVNSRFNPSPATAPAWPEIRIISVEAWLIVVPCAALRCRSLCLLDFHEEALGFRGVSIRIGGCRRQQICRCPCISSLILVDATEALVNRQPDLIDLLAVDHHGFQPTRDKG